MDASETLKKYFNSKEYATTIIGGSGEINSPVTNEDKITTLISLLSNPSNKEIREEALLTLKKEKGGETLLLAIASPKAKDVRNILVAACWESEINFSKYLPFFILLALDENYLVSLEAITTIENMEGPFTETTINEAIKKVQVVKKDITSERQVLLNDLVITLEGFLKNE
ncbi:MAG: hypothetical protein NTX97_04895 [Bacteroidetes bacterium]|nr:hypothetical protein [Bacteroidota bacterium]